MPRRLHWELAAMRLAVGHPATVFGADAFQVKHADRPGQVISGLSSARPSMRGSSPGYQFK